MIDCNAALCDPRIIERLRGRLIWVFMLMIFILFLVGGSGTLISIFFYMTGKQCMFTKKKEKVSRSLTLLDVYYSLDIGPVNTSLRDYEQRFG